MPNMDHRADGGCVSHAYTHLGFLEGSEMQGRTRDVADGKFVVYFSLLAVMDSGLSVCIVLLNTSTFMRSLINYLCNVNIISIRFPPSVA